MLFLSCGTRNTEVVLLSHMNWMIRLHTVYLGVWTPSLRHRMEDQALLFLRSTSSHSHSLLPLPIILREQKEKFYHAMKNRILTPLPTQRTSGNKTKMICGKTNSCPVPFECLLYASDISVPDDIQGEMRFENVTESEFGVVSSDTEIRNSALLQQLEDRFESFRATVYRPHTDFSLWGCSQQYGTT